MCTRTYVLGFIQIARLEGFNTIYLSTLTFVESISSTNDWKRYRSFYFRGFRPWHSLPVYNLSNILGQSPNKLMTQSLLRCRPRIPRKPLKSFHELQLPGALILINYLNSINSIRDFSRLLSINTRWSRILIVSNYWEHCRTIWCCTSGAPFTPEVRCHYWKPCSSNSWSADMLTQQTRDFPAEYHTRTPLQRQLECWFACSAD